MKELSWAFLLILSYFLVQRNCHTLQCLKWHSPVCKMTLFSMVSGLVNDLSLPTCVDMTSYISLLRCLRINLFIFIWFSRIASVVSVNKRCILSPSCCSYWQCHLSSWRQLQMTWYLHVCVHPSMFSVWYVTIATTSWHAQRKHALHLSSLLSTLSSFLL